MNYFIYIDGLAVSGSHGKERIPLLDIANSHLTNAMMVTD
jgi:hypothetical protein